MPKALRKKIRNLDSPQEKINVKSELDSQNFFSYFFDSNSQIMFKHTNETISKGKTHFRKFCI